MRTSRRSPQNCLSRCHPPSLIPVRSHLHLLQVKTKCFFMSAEPARTAAPLCSPGGLCFSHHPLLRGPILPLCSSWHGGALLLVCAGTTAMSTLGTSWLLPNISEKQFSKSVVTPTLTRNVRYLSWGSQAGFARLYLRDGSFRL